MASCQLRGSGRDCTGGSTCGLRSANQRCAAFINGYLVGMTNPQDVIMDTPAGGGSGSGGGGTANTTDGGKVQITITGPGIGVGIKI